MTKVTKAQVGIYTEASERVKFTVDNANRKHWYIFGNYYYTEKIGNKYFQRCRRAWNRKSKAEVAEDLADYDLTIEAFVAIANNEYEIEENQQVKLNLQDADNAVEEVAEVYNTDTDGSEEDSDEEELTVDYNFDVEEDEDDELIDDSEVEEIGNAEKAQKNAESPKYRFESVVYVDVYPCHYTYSVEYTNKRNVPMERSTDYLFIAHYGVVINQETGEIEYDFGCKNVLDGYFKSLPYTAENAVEIEDAVESVIADDIDSIVEDKLFGHAKFINRQAQALADSAAAVEGGDLCIEGKVVNIPDKKGKSRYYCYSWDGFGANQYDTTLEQIDEQTARKIAAKWHLAFSPMSFEEFMTASNAEYRKIRTLYLENGGGIARDYDAELCEKIKANKAQIDCLDLYTVTLDEDEMAEIEEINAKVAIQAEPTLIDKLRAKVGEQKNKPHKSIIDWEATFVDMHLEKQLEDETKKLASIKAEIKDRQQVLKDAIKNAVGNEDVYWKYAEKAKKQVSGWLKMYRDCVKNLANYRTQFAA